MRAHCLHLAFFSQKASSSPLDGRPVCFLVQQQTGCQNGTRIAQQSKLSSWRAKLPVVCGKLEFSFRPKLGSPL